MAQQGEREERSKEPRDPQELLGPHLRLKPPTPPPTHRGALTSSSSQSFRAWYWNRGRPPAPPRSRGAAACACGPRGFGPASSSGPWPPRRRLASGGAGKEREVLILPVNLWYSEAMGRRKLVHWLGCFEKRFPFSISLPYPHPLQQKREKGGKGGGGERRGKASPAAPRHSRVAWVLSDSAWLSFSAPSPAARKPGVGVIAFSFCFANFFFLSPRHGHVRPHQRDGRKARHQKHTREGTCLGPIIWHHLETSLHPGSSPVPPPWPLAAPPFPSQRGTQLQRW